VNETGEQGTVNWELSHGKDIQKEKSEAERLARGIAHVQATLTIRSFRSPTPTRHAVLGFCRTVKFKGARKEHPVAAQRRPKRSLKGPENGQ